MTIAVDFDGTIVENKYPEIGKELPFAIHTLQLLQEEGNRIILFTSREGELLDAAVAFCHERGLDFYSIIGIIFHYANTLAAQHVLFPLSCVR